MIRALKRPWTYFGLAVILLSDCSMFGYDVANRVQVHLQQHTPILYMVQAAYHWTLEAAERKIRKVEYA